jgi:lysophospholipase L1-like esterase
MADLEMAVLGDSIVWGQGLAEGQKFYTLVANWLQLSTGRQITMQVYAHSGAVIAPDTTGDSLPPTHRELPNSYPSVTAQVGLVANPHNIDFVLLDGGANDLGLRSLLDPKVDSNWYSEQAETICGKGMRDLLNQVLNTFPKARVIVTEYYSAISSHTDVTPLMLLWTALGISIATPLGPLGAAITYGTAVATREALSKRNSVWREASHDSLGWAANNCDDPGRVKSVDPQFGPGNAVFANGSGDDPWVWGFPQKDPAFDARMQACNLEGRGSDPLCQWANMIHPNAKGAQAYANAITQALHSWVSQPPFTIPLPLLILSWSPNTPTTGVPWTGTLNAVDATSGASVTADVIVSAPPAPPQVVGQTNTPLNLTLGGVFTPGVAGIMTGDGTVVWKWTADTVQVREASYGASGIGYTVVKPPAPTSDPIAGRGSSIRFP